MKIKTKITLGLGFLFTTIVLLGILAMHYLNSLAVDNQKLLEDNYRSLDYLSALNTALADIQNSFETDPTSRVSLHKIEFRIDAAIEEFEFLLEKQEHQTSFVNGEEELVDEIRRDFETLKGYIDVTRTKDYYFNRLLPFIRDLQLTINQVYFINDQYIQERNEIAQNTAQRVIYTVAAIVIFCILIAFTFMVSLPRVVTEPIASFTEALNKIQAGDYTTRVPVNKKNEFGPLALAFNDMAARLDHFERLNLRKILIEKNRIETLIRKIPEGIIGLDAELRILFCNPFARKNLALSEDELSGKHVHEVALENDFFKEVVGDLIEYQNTGKRYVRNKLIKTSYRDKPAYFIRKIIITTSIDDKSDSNGYIIMLKNITEFKEQDEARTHFIATVSHELKTPIAAIKMSLKLLRDKRLSELNEDQEELVEAVEWEINRLLNITQELLNASEVDTGKINIYPEWTPPYNLVEEAIDSVDTLAEDRKIQIIEDIDEDLPELHVDPDKTTWVLVNFLTNAIKYSNSKTQVTIGVKRIDDHIEFYVKDQGIGISPEEQKKVFERYYRVAGSKEKGSGIGLSVAKELIDQMGGKIGVESYMGQGSRFYIKLFSVKKESE